MEGLLQRKDRTIHFCIVLAVLTNKNRLVKKNAIAGWFLGENSGRRLSCRYMLVNLAGDGHHIERMSWLLLISLISLSLIPISINQGGSAWACSVEKANEQPTTELGLKPLVTFLPSCPCWWCVLVVDSVYLWIILTIYELTGSNPFRRYNQVTRPGTWWFRRRFCMLFRTDCFSACFTSPAGISLEASTWNFDQTVGEIFCVVL